MSWLPYSPELATDFTGIPADELRDRYGDTIWLRLRLDGGIEIKPTLSRHRELAAVTAIIAAARGLRDALNARQEDFQLVPPYPPVGDPDSSQVSGSPYPPKSRDDE